MQKQEICSFYVSENHLLTIILPYINEKINEGKEPIIITQKDLSIDVKKYLKCTEKFNENKEKILNLSWKKKKEFEEKNNEEIIIIGEENFLEKEKENISGGEINILNCYKIEKLERLDKIIEKYSICLNTKGLQNIVKNSQNAQKRKTIKSQL
jgi:hypothetical protein